MGKRALTSYDTVCSPDRLSFAQEMRESQLYVGVYNSGFLQWTKPLSTSLLLGTLADFGRSKSQLFAENALLCQQLIILHRQVKRPACSKADRTFLVLLARLVRTWERAIFLLFNQTHC